MLPFMKPKSIGAVMIHKMKPDGNQEPMHEEGQPDPGLVIAMEDFKKAMEGKNIHAMCEAFKNAFEIMESAPQAENKMEEGL